jgi:TolB-like protein
MRTWSLLIILVPCALAGCDRGTPPPSRARASFDSLAILPFTGEPDEPEAKPYARVLLDNLPDTLSRDIAAQAPPGSLKVIATQVVRDRKLPEQSAQQSGRDLNVAAILVGKLGPPRNELFLQLIAVDSGELLWAERYQTVQTFATAPWHLNGKEPEIVRNVIGKLTGNK